MKIKLKRLLLHAEALEGLYKRPLKSGLQKLKTIRQLTPVREWIVEYNEAISTWFKEKLPGRQQFDGEKEPELAQALAAYKAEMLEEEKAFEFSTVMSEKSAEKLKAMTGAEVELLLYLGMIDLEEEDEVEDDE